MQFYFYTITSFIVQYHCFVLYFIYIYITSVLLNIICCPRRRVQPHCHHVCRIPRQWASSWHTWNFCKKPCTSLQICKVTRGLQSIHDLLLPKNLRQNHSFGDIKPAFVGSLDDLDSTQSDSPVISLVLRQHNMVSSKMASTWAGIPGLRSPVSWFHVEQSMVYQTLDLHIHIMYIDIYIYMDVH